jgi:hypothetical protein
VVPPAPNLDMAEAVSQESTETNHPLPPDLDDDTDLDDDIGIEDDPGLFELASVQFWSCSLKVATFTLFLLRCLLSMCVAGNDFELTSTP